MAYSNESFATGLRMQRAKANISQKDLAEATGINPVLISQYEQGSVTPKIDKVWALSEALGCSPDDVMGWSAMRTARA